MKKLKFLPVLLAGLMSFGLAAGCKTDSNTPNDSDQNQTDDNQGGNNTENPGGNTENPDNPSTPGDNEKPSNPDDGKEPSTPTGDSITNPNSNPSAANTTIYFVGDSTVCEFSDNYYSPRYGYGTQLYQYLESNAAVKNLAMSGRSSYSFTTEGNYTTLINSIKAGDYLIIGFGHNDEKTETERYTNPNLPHTDGETKIGTRAASFQYVLNHYYIQVAIEKGATPILCTPVTRLDKSNSYTGSKIHNITTVTDGYPNGDYAKAIRDLGAAVNVPVIDLTTITSEDYKSKGYDEASKYHAATTLEWADASKTSTKPGGIDETHTNRFGAQTTAYYIARELVKANHPMSAYIKGTVTRPAASEYEKAVDKNFKVNEYAPFDPAKKSSKWTVTAEGWYGSVFGDMGSDNPSSSNFTVQQLSETSFKVGTSGGKGKISGSSDGFACVFKQIEGNRNFTISATATVDNYNSNNQAGFGIMLRDDMYIDRKVSPLASNYIAAGCYGANAIFKRENKALAPFSSATVAQGAQIELKLEKENQTYRVWFGDKYTTYTDFDLVAVDNDYIYICLFATRDMMITFTNVTYTDNGLGVGA